MKPHRRLLLLSLILVGLQLSITGSARGQETCDNNLYIERALAYERMNDPRAEREYRMAASDHGGKCAEALLDLTDYLKQNLRLREAATALQEYIRKAAPEDREVYLEELATLRRGAEFKSRADNGEPVPLRNLLELVALVQSFGRQGPAVPYAEKAVQSYPNSTKAILALVAALPNGQEGRKMELLDKAVELEPANAEVRTARGLFYWWRRQRYVEAEAELRKALELDGQKCDAWYGLGHMLMYRGQKREAATAFRNYLRICKSPAVNRPKVERLIEELEPSK